jgi:hypothetical protein
VAQGGVAGHQIKSAREPTVFAAAVRCGVAASRPFKPATLSQEPRVAYGNGFAAAFLLVVTSVVANRTAKMLKMAVRNVIMAGAFALRLTGCSL